MKKGLLLDVVVGERAPVLELPSRKDEALGVRGNALLVPDLALDRVLHNMRESVRSLLRARDVGRGLRQRRLQRLRSWRSASHVSSYYYICALILLHVSSYYYICVVILLSTYGPCNFWLVFGSSGCPLSAVRPHTTAYVFFYF